MGTTAVFGASGQIGRSVADAFRSEGVAYRVVGRSKASLEKEFGSDPLAEIVTWDPDEAATVRAAAHGVDTIVYLVGVPYTDFARHPILMRKTIDAAIAEGVERLVLVGTVYPFGVPRTRPVTEDHPREPHTFKGRMRKEQEDVLLEADAAGSIRGTILRLPDFYGPGVERSFLWGTFRAAVDGTRAQMVGPIDPPHEFAFVPDVGPVLAALAREPRAYGRSWNFAGAGAITQREISEMIFAAAGRRPKRLVAGKLMVRAIGLFNPFMREVAEMQYLMERPLLLDDSALHGLLGPLRKTSYEDGVRQTVAALRAAQGAPPA